MVRPLVERVSNGGIIAPDVALDARTNRNTLGRGRVVAFGDLALAKDGETEIDRGFDVTSEVLFIGQHESRLITQPLWTCKACGCASLADSPYDIGDSEPCVFCEEGTARVTWEKVRMVAQEEVCAVIE